ncbi:MAG: hypothetical protein AB7I50_22645 [Vicinamibacterales bacterium]
MNRTCALLLVVLATVSAHAAGDPRQIVSEVQKRSRADSQQY